MVSMYPFWFIMLIISGANSVSLDHSKTIETTNGPIRGKLGATFLNNISYYSFKGIPYAKPPIGKLRFKAPEPVEPWKPNVLDAFEHGNICIQPVYTIQDFPFPQNENCLSLNIYVPADKKPDENLSILFFIHGGGFMEGCGNDYVNGNDFLIEQNVILVTLNYRLGVFGFLSLDTPEYSGNMGAKDQQMALKWVSENIDRFGGDNQRITLIGHSAGSALVHFHTLSPESRKYFRNAICMSGSVENYWAFAKENNNLALAHEIAKKFGQPQNSIAKLAEFLQKLEVDKLKPYSTLKWMRGTTVAEFAPVIERKDAIQPFIVESPSEIYEKSNIDTNVLFTFTSLEVLGVIFLPGFFPSLEELNSNFNLSLPFRDVEIDANSKLYSRLLDEIRQFYFGNGTIDQQTLYQYVSLFSDINFAYGIDRAAKMHASKSRGNTFYSRFSMNSKLNNPTSHNGIYLQGTSHADELCYLFRCHSQQSVYDDIINNKFDEQSKVSLQTIRFITKIFTNFAKYDEPTHQGEPIGSFDPIENRAVHFLDITNKGIIPGLAPNQEANNLWTRIKQRV